jgi:hypothetical protein
MISTRSLGFSRFLLINCPAIPAPTLRNRPKGAESPDSPESPQFARIHLISRAHR